MSKITKKEIEEMRKRLPFKAVVWQSNTPAIRDTEKVVYIKDNLRAVALCGEQEIVIDYDNFEEIKEPAYVPFTADDFKEFAGKWIIDDEGDHQMIMRFNNMYVHIDNGILSYKEAFVSWKFADTGKSFGKEMKQ